MRLNAFALLFCLLPPMAMAEEALAQSQPDELAPLPTTVMAEVLVTGEQPGPGLWRISRGENTMWLLGNQSPLPRRMRWRSDEVQALVASSQAVLASPTIKFDSDIGRIRGLFLLPALLGARRNPGKETLEEVLPQATYQRWSLLRQRYLPRSRGVEKWRPLFAAQKLYEAAVEDSGLRFDNIVWPVVEKAAKRARVEVVQPAVTVRIEAPRDAIKDFSKTSLDDLACLELTLERLETDLESMRDRANAWSVGDVALLRELPFTDQGPACIEAMLQSSVMSERGFADLPQRFRAAWLEAAQKALEENAQSFAVLPMRLVLGDDGYVAELQRMGYEVEAPQ
jgi:hypothetical protein